ncbi:cellulase family glycosylhydrolase [Vibrio sp. SM6]|uniref:Cellulase family glycosylhydrolase n=2 Tax=Vibrio agarilyticus TaxID=2726741 RepID=A0A7X8TQR7_9VIBR|nr:cellulase family glycosylhydrolase [Vibrio agarilyticus]
MKILSLSVLIAMTGAAEAGFHVNAGQLLDGNGQPFVMRGVNHGHAWFADKMASTIADIAHYKANTVRMVISNGVRWQKTPAHQIRSMIATAKQNHLITVLDVHDTTGFGEQQGASSLSTAVDYWIEMKDELIGQEDYVIINIGNEPFGNHVTAQQWTEAHKQAISRLRAAGFNHTLMVDAPNWGQDWQNIMRNYAADVFTADPQQNLVFSVHMYEVYNNYSVINQYISAFGNKALPLVVGEFSQTHKGHYVDADTIMERSVALGVGYLGWSWSGNDNSTADLDIALDWNRNTLSTWGNKIIHGTNGIMQTSIKASVFSTTEPFPICKKSSSDPDGDGWGWENNQSCQMNPHGYAPNGYLYCGNANSDPDGDGWGWENNYSCVMP